MRPLPDGPIRVLLDAWPSHLNRFVIRDVVVNIALYVPLGMSAYFAFRRSPLKLFEYYGPVLLGLLLSTCVELTQIYEPARDASALDIATNVIGSILGVFLAILFEIFTEPATAPSVKRGVTDRAAVGLLFTGAAYLMFPLLPALSRFALEVKLTAFARAPLLRRHAVLVGLSSLVCGRTVAEGRRHPAGSRLAWIVDPWNTRAVPDYLQAAGPCLIDRRFGGHPAVCLPPERRQCGNTRRGRSCL